MFTARRVQALAFAALLWSIVVSSSAQEHTAPRLAALYDSETRRAGMRDLGRGRLGAGRRERLDHRLVRPGIESGVLGHRQSRSPL
jgi:hypothetical protein